MFQSSKGVADQNIRRQQSIIDEQTSKFFSKDTAGARERTRFAVAETGTVIGTHLSECGNPGLHLAPRIKTVGESGIENDDRRSTTHTGNMHAISANIHKCARHRVRTKIAVGAVL
jgi:hypothetical protein